ncbi:hypothetical protein PG996_009468 [Apiospora saccharicola]|uniref:SH3 domain-containing protein n=1 Tax=Apiospora saccharicola TaxID=335842 RepID=A0ABR1UNS4_9PEZI
MADEVERLILAPFKEIVEKANVAIANAEGADDDVAASMLKAAQSLAKEGERALTRIEPLCAKNYEQYGTNFVDAIKEHDEIAQYRAELEDLLWDFDDYVEVDEFAADKFDELQKTSRKAAPRLMDILKRMKLVEPATPSLQSPTSPSFGNPFSLNRSSLPPGEESQVVVQPSLVSPNDRSMDEVEKQLSLMMKPQVVPAAGIRTPGSASDLDRSNSHRSEISTTPSEPPPPPPSINPWQVGQPPPTFGSDCQVEGGSIPERRPVVSADDSPTLPVAVPAVSPRTQQEGHRRHRSQHSVINEDPAQSDDEATQRLSTSSSQVDRESGYGQIMPMRSASIAGHRVRANSAGQGGLGRNDTRRTSTQSSTSTWSSRPPSAGSLHYVKAPPIIEHSRVTYAATGYPPRITSLAEPKGHTMRQPSADSISSSIFDCVPDDDLPSPENDTLRSPTSPHGYYDYNGNRPPSYATVAPKYRHHMAPNERPITVVSDTPTLTSLVPPPLGPLPPQPRSRTRSFRDQNQQPRVFEQQQQPQTPPQQQQVEAGLETANTPGRRLDDPGIIPVETEAHEEIGPMPSRKPDCNIGPHSSFYQLKGFCKGAEEAVSGGLGFKKIKRPVGGFSTMIVAKCTHCLYELDYKSVEQDLKNDSTGNYTSNSVGFRLRVLQKSHLSNRHIDDQFYACIFCIRQGRTLEESDSTVFFNQKQLFSHMARHPRPLPVVSGFTVIEGNEILPHLKENFDLWFPNPPTTSVMPAISLEVGRLPTAVATETRKLTHGILRSPPDRAPVLEYAVGARIVGIEFPPRYEGKWAMGWHDGVRGVFESDTVKLEPPSRSEVRMQGNSNMQAVARWKFRQSGGEGNWLKFNKGDVIENICLCCFIRLFAYPGDTLSPDIGAYTDHWCWSGTSSKHWGIFPQTHVDPDSVQELPSGGVRDGSGNSIASAEKKSTMASLFSIRKTSNTADRKLLSRAGNEPSGPRLVID